MCNPSFFSLGIAFFLDCLKYDFTRQLHSDAKLIVCMYHVTWLFPDQYSFLCCGLCVIYSECTHDGDMLCITGTTH